MTMSAVTSNLSQQAYTVFYTGVVARLSDEGALNESLVKEKPIPQRFSRFRDSLSDTVTKLVALLPDSEASASRFQQKLLDVNDISISSDAVRRASSPWVILSGLAVSTSVESIHENLDKLRKHRTRERVVNLIRQALRGQESPPLETSLPALQKRALLELLLEFKSVDVEEDLLFHIEREEMNEFLYACVAAIRLVPPQENTLARAVELLRKRIDDAGSFESLSNPIKNNVVRQAILALGAYGDLQDMDLLLGLLRNDLGYKLGDQTTYGLCQLLARFPDSVPASTEKELHDLARELLCQWTQPRVIHNQDIFAQSSQIVKLLCARLDPRDLRIALGAVLDPPNPSLSRMMLQYIQSAKAGLEYRGHKQWLESNSHDVEEIERRVKDVIH